MCVLSALNSTMEEVRVRYIPNRAKAERNASDAPSSSDGPRPMVGKLLVTNQAGRICRGSDADRDWCPVIIHHPALRIIAGIIPDVR